MDLIDDVVTMTKYLRSKLPQRMKTTGRPDQIIRTFSANLTANTRTQILQDLKDEATEITVCNECA